MISSIIRYLGISYHECMNVIPWTVLQGMIATIPPSGKSDAKSKKSNDEPMSFFDFGAKLTNFKYGNDRASKDML